MEPSGGRGRFLLVTILVTTAIMCVQSGKRIGRTTGRKIKKTIIISKLATKLSASFDC